MSSYAITGAARGIGFEFVNQLSAESANTVFALVRNKPTAHKLAALGRPNVHIIQADITDNEALKVAAEEVSKVTGGSLDHLINNAAFLQESTRGNTLDNYPSEDLLTKDLVDSFNINVVAVVHTINIFLPLLKKGKAKKVITISSGMGDAELVVGSECVTASPYSISKAAVNLVVAKYAAQYKLDGFTFLALSPGFVDTSVRPPTAQELEEFKEMLRNFRNVYPDFAGPITPETSVKMQLDVINKVTVADTGAFISHKGNKEWL
ncbi:NAD(P)-binding protein [Leucogyrophana mollusca]|uniref:NAD(P)-binding protein n=1 Tax=Leucogyrophana mollusca TaxID=85980 RepID=A0ACB8BX27_9AGAM|nr:NAD(P)-binding protein [Leucogyrophana mollusca]